MVNHTVLAGAYARAGFALYPTTYPETGCVSLMKAQAMGAIPVTSRYARSTLPELCGEHDLGPRAINGSLQNDPSWPAEWADAVVAAARTDGTRLAAHRDDMVRSARRRFLWSHVAQIWARTFAEDADRGALPHVPGAGGRLMCGFPGEVRMGAPDGGICKAAHAPSSAST